MKIVWTEMAATQLAAIYAYVASSSTVYASRLIRRIRDRTARLGPFP